MMDFMYVRCDTDCVNFESGKCTKGNKIKEDTEDASHCKNFELKLDNIYTIFLGEYEKKVLEAFKNCVDKPKCKNCPWEACEDFYQEKVVIPRTLADAVRELLDKLTD